MKKVYLFLLALVTIAIGARAQLVKVGSGQVAKVTVGDTIQSLDSLKKAVEDTTQLFVIQNYGDAHDSHAAFYQESATASEGINAFTATADQRTLVKLKKLTDSTYTIQAYSGRYYATSGGNQQSVNTADTASTFVIRATNTGTTLANGFRVFSNNTYLNTTGSSPNKKPVWNTTGGTGNYSIVRIYKASASITDLNGFQDLQTAINTASAYTVGTGLSQYTDAEGIFTQALSSAKTLAAVDEDPAKNGEYEEAATALTAAISSLSLNMPTDSMYLLIKNKLNGGYLTAPATVNTATFASTTSLQSDSAQVWQYHIKGNSGVQGYLKSHFGNYLETNWQTTTNNNASGASGTTIEANPAVPGTYRIYVPRGGWYYGFVNDSTSGSVSSTKLSGSNIDFSNPAYAWELEAITLATDTVIPTPEPQPEPVVDSTAVKVAAAAATSINTTKWYMMAGYQSNSTDNRYVYYTNSGHSVYGSTVGFYVNTTSPFSGDSVKADSTNMDYLFRFIPAGTDSTYYIQTATGKFFAELFDNDGKGANSQTLKSDTTAHAYVIKNFNDASSSYFAIRCAANSVLMHNNSAPNNNVVGWGTATPSTIPNNNVWQFFETTYQNDSLPTPKPEPTPTPTPTPEPTKEYTYVLNTHGQPANAVITLSGTPFTETDGVLLATKSNQMTIDSLQVSDVESYTHTVSLADTVFTVTFLCQAIAPDTVSSKYVVVAEHPAASLETGKWYMLAGYQSNSSDNRYVYYTTSGSSVYGSTTGFRVSTTNPFDGGQVQVSQDNINYLVRLIRAATGNEYFIQTAGGQYFAELQDNEALGRNPATLQATASGYPYTIATFNEATYPTYFAIHCATNNILMHNNGGNNNNVVGWSTGVPSVVPNNNVWQFFEVSLTDEIVGINSASIDINNARGYNPSAPAYNLQGQRVGNGYKGVVIQGGKKYIVK